MVATIGVGPLTILTLALGALGFKGGPGGVLILRLVYVGTFARPLFLCVRYCCCSMGAVVYKFRDILLEPSSLPSWVSE